VPGMAGAAWRLARPQQKRRSLDGQRASSAERDQIRDGNLTLACRAARAGGYLFRTGSEAPAMNPEERSPSPRAVADLTPEEAAERLADVEKALATLVNAMIDAADNRIIAVATKCVEMLRGLIAALKEQT